MMWGDDPWTDLFAPRRSGTDGYPDGTRAGLRRPRRLSGDDVDAFTRAAEAQPARPPTMTAARWYTGMRKLFPYRIRRMEKDLRWLQKQAVKNGVDPEMVRHLL